MSNSKSDDSSTASLRSSKTTSSNFTTSSKKVAKSLLQAVTRRGKGDADTSSSSQVSSTMQPPVSNTSKPSTQHPAPRDWDAAFGRLATDYGFGGAVGPTAPIGMRPVAPSNKFKARTAPDLAGEGNSTPRAGPTKEENITVSDSKGTTKNK